MSAKFLECLSYFPSVHKFFNDLGYIFTITTRGTTLFILFTVSLLQEELIAASELRNMITEVQENTQLRKFS